MGEEPTVEDSIHEKSAPPSDWFAQLPKVELHCHIEGTMRPQTVAELSAAHGVALPAASLDELFIYSEV